jgi:hypothetical protein
MKVGDNLVSITMQHDNLVIIPTVADMPIIYRGSDEQVDIACDCIARFGACMAEV